MAAHDDRRLSAVLNRRQHFILKLINLYEQNECLWNIWNTDFLNIPLKQKIWERIANELGEAVTVDSIKTRIHRMCYKINLEKLHEREAMLLHDIEAPQKLYYSDKFKFINSVFKKNNSIAKTQTTEVQQTPQSTRTLNSLERLSDGYRTQSQHTIRKQQSQASRLEHYEKMRNPQIDKVRHTIYKRLQAASETPPFRSYFGDCFDPSTSIDKVLTS